MLKVLELFGGIGACSKALERLGIEHEVVDYVEIDKYAVKSFNAIHNTNFEPQDIMTWGKDIEVDLIMHGSPCQDFSLAGKQDGGDKNSGTRSSLLYETIRIVAKLKPKYVIWENVKNVISQKHRHNFDEYLNEMKQLGYSNYYQVLNAKDYGIPQNRERVFTISIRNDFDEDGIEILDFFDFPPKQELKLRLKDMLEDEVDEKYYLKTFDGFVYKKYKDFEDNRGYTPNMFNPYNTQEIKDIAPTQSTCCGSTTSSATVLIKEATKKGYKEAYEGDSVNLAYPESKTRRDRVGEQVSQTLQCNDSMGVVEYSNYSKKKIEQNLKSINSELIGTLTANCMQSINHDNCQMTFDSNLRIRKLTPLECWRLMGFDDEDFEKANLVNSNSQLYKQAGNSIVCNVLEAIFKELL